MAAIRRGFPKGDAFLSAGNTGTLTIMPMGRGIGKVMANSKNLLNCALRKSSFKLLEKI